MKRIITLLVLVLSFGLYAQEYNTWSIEGGLGGHWVADQSAKPTDNFNHYNLTVRKYLSPVFGLGLYGGLDNLSLTNKTGELYETDYARLTLEGVIHASKLLQIDNQTFNILTHGGVGIVRIGEDKDYGDYYQATLGLSGGITGLIKLSERVAIKLDWTTTLHANQDYTLDNAFEIKNSQINSIVNNLTLGAVIGLGKRKQHTDWHTAPVVPIIKNIYIDRTITNVHEAKIVQQACECAISENVYFVNDGDVIDIQGLNAIEKVADYLAENKGASVQLTGSASPTKSTTDEYDLDLSKRRVEAVEAKLIKLGVDDLRITIEYIGKDNDRDDIHEFARKVSLTVE